MSGKASRNFLKNGLTPSGPFKACPSSSASPCAMPSSANSSSIASSRPLFQTSSNQRWINDLFSSDMIFLLEELENILPSFLGTPAMKIYHALENPIERHLWAKADQLVDLRDVRHSARHVFETLFVCFVVRHEGDLGLGAGQLLDALGQLKDCDLFVRADVEDLSDSVRVTHQFHERADDIADIAEAARLLAITVNRHLPSSQGLLN